MNFGAFNAIAVNGSPLDSAVRSQTVGYCYAVAAPKSTYLADGAFRFRVQGDAQAQATVVPRVMSRTPLGVYEASAQATVFARIQSRAPLNGVMSAGSTPRFNRLLGQKPVYGTAEAQSTPTLRIGQRVAVYGVCSAQSSISSQKSKSPLTGVCSALGFISGGAARYKWDYPADIRIVVPYTNNKFTVR